MRLRHIAIGLTLVGALLVTLQQAVAQQDGAQEISGELVEGDLTIEDGAYYDVHEVDFVAGQVVEASASTDGFDFQLIQANANGDFERTATGVRGHSVAIKLRSAGTESGTMNFLVAASEPGQGGSYTLRLSGVGVQSGREMPTRPLSGEGAGPGAGQMTEEEMAQDGDKGDWRLYPVLRFIRLECDEKADRKHLDQLAMKVEIAAPGSPGEVQSFPGDGKAIPFSGSGVEEGETWTAAEITEKSGILELDPLTQVSEVGTEIALPEMQPGEIYLVGLLGYEDEPDVAGTDVVFLDASEDWKPAADLRTENPMWDEDLRALVEDFARNGIFRTASSNGNYQFGLVIALINDGGDKLQTQTLTVKYGYGAEGYYATSIKNASGSFAAKASDRVVTKDQPGRYSIAGEGRVNRFPDRQKARYELDFEIALGERPEIPLPNQSPATVEAGQWASYISPEGSQLQLMMDVLGNPGELNLTYNSNFPDLLPGGSEPIDRPSPQWLEDLFGLITIEAREPASFWLRDRYTSGERVLARTAEGQVLTILRSPSVPAGGIVRVFRGDVEVGASAGEQGLTRAPSASGIDWPEPMMELSRFSESGSGFQPLELPGLDNFPEVIDVFGDTEGYLAAREMSELIREWTEKGQPELDQSMIRGEEKLGIFQAVIPKLTDGMFEGDARSLDARFGVSPLTGMGELVTDFRILRAASDGDFIWVAFEFSGKGEGPKKATWYLRARSKDEGTSYDLLDVYHGASQRSFQEMIRNAQP